VSEASLAGRRIGDFEITEELGGGRLGPEFAASSRVGDAGARVLRVGPELGPGVALSERLLFDLERLERLRHPGLVSLLDVELDGPDLLLVYAEVDACSLAERVSVGPLEIEEAGLLAGRLIGALAMAHSQGVLHRDIRLESILVGPGGACLAHAGLGPPVLDGDPLGAAWYRAPELWGAAEPSPASDIYALGICLYRGLTGRLPFPEDLPVDSYARVHVGTEVPDVRMLRPDTPEWLAELVHVMTRRELHRRAGDAGPLVRSCRSALGPLPELSVAVDAGGDPTSEELELPDPDEWGLEQPTRVGGGETTDPSVLGEVTDSGALEVEPLDPDEWELDQPTRVGAHPEPTDPGGEWSLDQPTRVGELPAGPSTSPQQPTAAPPPRRAPPPRKRSMLRHVPGCSVLTTAALLAVTVLICGVGHSLGWWHTLVAMVVDNRSKPVVVEEAPRDEPVASPEVPEPEPEAEAEAPEEEEGSEEAEGQEEAPATARSSSSSRSSRSSRRPRTPEPEPEPEVDLDLDLGFEEAEDEGPTTARLVIQLRAKRRKDMRDAYVVIDEERVGAPPVSVDVAVGTRYVEWRGNGFHHICVVEVPAEGRTVTMDLQDGECPW